METGPIIEAYVTKTEFSKMDKRVETLEKKMAEKDTQFAVINTKLSAILWGVGVLSTALVGVLVKLIFNV